MKTTGQAGPPRFPFNYLPTLTFGHGARGGKQSVLAETGAILSYLEQSLRTEPNGSSPDMRARMEMIQEASLAVLDKCFSMAKTSPTWLQPPHRSTLLTSIIQPYLTSLEYHLTSSFYPPLLTHPFEDGRPGTSLSPASAAATTALSVISDLFENTLGAGNGGGMEKRFPRCENLRRAVESRPNIKKWIEEGGRDNDWMRVDCGKRDFISKMAKEFDSEIGNSASFFVR